MAFEGEIWREIDPAASQHAYWTQPNFLTHVAHLLKPQDIKIHLKHVVYLTNFAEFGF